MQKRFKDLKAGDEFTDAHEHPRQTRRWVALTDAKDENRRALVWVWSITAKAEIGGETKTFYAGENNLVETPRKK